MIQIPWFLRLIQTIFFIFNQQVKIGKILKSWQYLKNQNKLQKMQLCINKIVLHPDLNFCMQQFYRIHILQIHVSQIPYHPQIQRITDLIRLLIC
ncbi:hypothetical protein pb186bvf_009250 [Paramecium bursaria]